MQKSRSTEGLLIVVELAAEWPTLPVEALPQVRRVLAQDETESPAAFAVRVGEQLNGLFARGVPLSSAVIACNERLDEHALGARAELARAAASALAKARGGSLLLSAADRNGGRSRAALSVLVSELGKEWQSAAVDAQLRFAEDAALSIAAGSPARPSSKADRAKDSVRRVA